MGHEAARGAAGLADALAARRPVTLPPGRAGLDGDNAIWYAGDVAYSLSCEEVTRRPRAGVPRNDMDDQVADCLAVIVSALYAITRDAAASGAYPATESASAGSRPVARRSRRDVGAEHV